MERFGSIYFTILGLAASVFGILSFVVLGVYGIEGVTWGALDISDPDWGGVMLVWEGIILVCAGVMYLFSARKLADIRGLGLALVASIMVWIILAMGIWAMIAGSIPGGEEGGWFVPSDVADIWTTPKSPGMWLGLGALVIIPYIARFGRRRGPRI